MNETKVALASAGPQGTSVELGERELSLKPHLDYWRDRLAGVPPALELPTDRPRPPVQRFQPDNVTSKVPTTLSNAIQELSRETGAGIAETLLAAFEVLLFRYTGQADLVLGCSLPGIDSSFVVRGDFSNPPSFRACVVSASEYVQSARTHIVPTDLLLHTLNCDNNPSRNPLFQVLFSFEESPESQVDTPSVAPPVDLHLTVRHGSNRTVINLSYDRQLFDPPTISRMMQQFEVLLNGITATPNESIVRLPIQSDAERQKVLFEWNQTHADYPRSSCVHQLFEEQVRHTPQATAVVFEGRQLTYADLNRRSNQLANYLLKFGVGPDVLVGLCVERGLDMVVGLLGVLKAGAAYVPLDPAFPSDRLAFMLDDGEAPVLLTQQSLLKTLPGSKAKLVCLDAEWPEIAKQSELSPTVDVTPEHLAYTIYTSGSTGKPKGVQVLHRGVVNFLISMSRRPGMNSGDRVLSVTTLSFDIAGLEIYLPLIVGGSVEIVSREVAADGAELLTKLGHSGATVMQATPATWRMLLDAGWSGTPGLKILCGGEALSQKLASQLLDKCGSLWNMYGPTETTIWSTLSQLERDHNFVGIGHPIANTQIYILDSLLQPVPIGVAGELHIGGDGVARGYLKRPELSQSKFIRDPFSGNPKACLYRTGDLARYLPSGEIEFLGRIDHQVKIRGFRIELGEIEGALRQYPAVGDAVVIDREDTPGDKRLVAYVVPERGAEPSSSEFRAFLKERLPDYMLPSAFVLLKAMPLTPNGKVDRRALPAPGKMQLISKAETLSPRDETEKALSHIWEEVLKVSPIGVRDNFFELGGHSLLAVRMMHRAAQRFGKHISAATLFQAPTIELLAAIFRQGDWTPHWTSLVPVQPGDARSPFFCVHGAGGVIIRFRELAHYLGPEQPVYGFQAQGLNELLPCHNRVEDMAAHYIQEMRSIQPHGPYFLGGYSFGGLIALEMAQQLRTLQEETALIVLFDTFCTPSFKAPGSERRIPSLFLKFVQSVRNESLAKSAQLISKGIRRRLHHMTVPRRLKVVRKACEHAAREYVPRNYDGHVVLFRSSRPPVTVSDPYAGWNSYIQDRLDTYEIVSDHDNIMLEPQVRVVAEHLKAHLSGLHRGLKTREIVNS